MKTWNKKRKLFKLGPYSSPPSSAEHHRRIRQTLITITKPSLSFATQLQQPQPCSSFTLRFWFTLQLLSLKTTNWYLLCKRWSNISKIHLILFVDAVSAGGPVCYGVGSNIHLGRRFLSTAVDVFLNQHQQQSPDLHLLLPHRRRPSQTSQLIYTGRPRP